MKVIRSEVMGMCFGVRDALRLLDQVENPQEVVIHGEFVHNEAVLLQLHQRGFQMVSEQHRDKIPSSNIVMITAHGISDSERKRLETAGRQLLDSTCPLVKRAHQAAQKLQQDGYHVLVIGKPGHVEVEGIVGDLTSYDVVQGPVDVRTYPHQRLGIMCQTTTPERLALMTRQAITDKNPHAEIRYIDTICHPTKDHQKALEQLLDEVQVMVIVGGKNSNNTRAMVARCHERNVPAFHVQSAADLKREWFISVDTVGLTAGTSTLDTTIDEVYQALLEM